MVCLVLFGQGRVGLAGQGLGGGPRASVPGGVGGRGTAQGRSKFRNVCRIFVVSAPELAWWTGGRPRALVAGEGWGA